MPLLTLAVALLAASVALAQGKGHQYIEFTAPIFKWFSEIIFEINVWYVSYIFKDFVFCVDEVFLRFQRKRIFTFIMWSVESFN